MCSWVARPGSIFCCISVPIAERVASDELAPVIIWLVYTGFRFWFSVSAYDALCGMFNDSGTAISASPTTVTTIAATPGLNQTQAPRPAVTRPTANSDQGT